MLSPLPVCSSRNVSPSRMVLTFALVAIDLSFRARLKKMNYRLLVETCFCARSIRISETFCSDCDIDTVSLRLLHVEESFISSFLSASLLEGSARVYARVRCKRKLWLEMSDKRRQLDMQYYANAHFSRSP
jgi:hypothetical protein